MKLAIISSHSDQNRELAELTAQNHWEFSARHGYDLVVIRQTYEEYKSLLVRGGIQDYMHRSHDAVVLMGSDVVFTNFAKNFDEFLDRNYGVIVTKEHGVPGHSPINSGVAIYMNNPQTTWFCSAIRHHAEDYLAHERLDQQFMVDLMGLEGKKPWSLKTGQQIVKVLPARTFNSHAFEGTEGSWQPGDLLVHCFCVEKVPSCKHFLSKVQK